ncbi:peptide methionine sulfoxide reductase-like [Ctenocephalides felis]|uniref:peptide methionine sulfoxide reductase-like n=1 Tax=Ctenocephalides felis TaxID=7515 RepID=UPI000E6E2063|nr:peptide methionine sulfoxide reductase-like [Ctenocephalides felis]
MLKGINKIISSFSHSGGSIRMSSNKYLHNVDVATEKATFGMGCFWSCDSLYGATLGVIRTRVGYSGGKNKEVSYRNIGDHTEVIDIDFDPTVITYAQLLDIFWNHHEYGLLTKVKRQYMSLILYHNEQQKEIAEKSFKSQAVKLNTDLITEIKKFEVFHPAEDYHQKYRLQGHSEFMLSLGLKPGELLQTSHLAARLNGYLVGQGGEKQFLAEASKLGLNDEEQKYVLKYLKKYEGAGLFC